MMVSPTALAGPIALLLPLAFEVLPGTTWTVQTSTDLAAWETLPAVFTEPAQTVSLALGFPGRIGFARLRFDDDGDSNNNNLPDLWEWQVFGFLDVDPADDPDGDGQDNFAEWLAGTEPLDPYNGETPEIRLACGREWLVRAATRSQQAVSLVLLKPDGDPWPGMPVRLSLPSGQARLVRDGQPDTEATAVCELRTDAAGRLERGLQAVRFLAPSQGGNREVLKVTAGSALTEIRIQTLPASFGDPPRNLKESVLDDDRVAWSWEGDPEGSDGFILERQSEEGSWERLVEMSGEQLDDPGPDGRYHWVVDHPPPD